MIVISDYLIISSYSFLKVVPRSGYCSIVTVESNGSEHLLLHGSLHSLAEHVAQNPTDEHHDEYYEQYDEILQHEVLDYENQ